MTKVFIFMSLFMINSNLISEKALYDTVGITYDSTRCADPEITKSLIRNLSPQINGKYIDVCCGSGNYTVAIHNSSVNLEGIDISEVMLEKAKVKSNKIQWSKGDAHNLPYENNSFEGALCINAIHHLGNLELAFKEIFRILKPGSRLVIFTTMKEQCRVSWTNYYFPFIWGVGQTFLQDEESITRSLTNSGFNKVEFEKFFITKDTEDLYLYAGKYKPEIYLNQIVRDGMTPFNKPEFAQQTAEGLIKLEADIKSGKIHEIVAQHEKNLGENVFVIAIKN